MPTRASLVLVAVYEILVCRNDQETGRAMSNHSAFGSIVDTLLGGIRTIGLPDTAIHVRRTDYQMDWKCSVARLLAQSKMAR